MGLGAIAYGIIMKNGPKRIVVTEVSDERLARAKELLSVEYARENGVELHYVNTAHMENEVEELMKITDGRGYDDVFIYTPIKSVAETGNAVLAFDGCMNLFAGPTNNQFKAEVNLYDSHYKNTRILGCSGSQYEDFMEAINLVQTNQINGALMITHIGGLDAYAETVLNLPKIPGSKKLIYPQINMPLTAISDFRSLEDPFFTELADVCDKYNGLWNKEAEVLLLEHFLQQSI